MVNFAVRREEVSFLQEPFSLAPIRVAPQLLKCQLDLVRLARLAFSTINEKTMGHD